MFALSLTKRHDIIDHILLQGNWSVALSIIGLKNVSKWVVSFIPNDGALNTHFIQAGWASEQVCMQ